MLNEINTRFKFNVSFFFRNERAVRYKGVKCGGIVNSLACVSLNNLNLTQRIWGIWNER